MAVLYQVEDVYFDYVLCAQKTSALRDINCEIDHGDFVCLSGPSGSGKSTLLNLLGLIEPVQTGKIRLQEKYLDALSESEKNELRKYELGFVFQSFHLFPVLTAEENVEYFISKQGIVGKERQNRTQEALTAVGLWEHRRKKPLEMSGGQRQRVAIARAIAKRPKVIIADEPTASLDQHTGTEIMKLFLELNRERGITFIVSSHDPMVLKYGRTHFYLRDGTLRVSQDRYAAIQERYSVAQEI